MGRLYAVLLAVAIFTTGAGIYLLTVLSPYDSAQIELLIMREQITRESQLQEELSEIAGRGLLWSYLDQENILIITALAFIAVVSFATFVQLGVEQLSVKRPGYRPHMYRAVRRAVLVFVGLLSAAVYRLIAADNYLAWLTWVFLIIVEVLITRFGHKPSVTVADKAVIESAHANS